MTLKVIAASLAIYVVYLPLAIFVHRDYVPIDQPKGRLVELIHKFEEQDGHLQAQVFANATYLKATLYENLTPIAQVDILALPWRPPSWRFVRMPIPGPDPRKNGQRYYVVQE